MVSGETTFGVSGLLYNSNVIPYDRQTNSHWSQLLLHAIHGPLKGSEAENLQVIETTWKTWKEMYPDAKIVTNITGYNRNYHSYPYGDYRTNNNALLFPIHPEDIRLPYKERVLAVVIKGKAKVYRFSSLTNNEGIIKDEFQGWPLIIVGSKEKNIMVAFENKLPDGSLPEFKLKIATNNFLQDQHGDIWNVFGEAVTGTLKGKKLKAPPFIIGYWFGFGAFYSETEIY